MTPMKWALPAALIAMTEFTTTQAWAQELPNITTGREVEITLFRDESS